jgi:hypothetical protein
MLAPNFSTSTCIATIPASSTPSSGIQARPRTIRSSSGWSGSARMNAAARAGSGPWTAGVGLLLAGFRAVRDGPETRRGERGACCRRTSPRCPAVRADPLDVLPRPAVVTAVGVMSA